MITENKSWMKNLKDFNSKITEIDIFNKIYVEEKLRSE